MRWVVEYYELADTTQPAELFEDSLKRHHKKLGAKLRAIAAAIEVYAPQLGGGLIEPCHDYKGLWEIRTIFNGFLVEVLRAIRVADQGVFSFYGYVCLL